MAKHIRPLYITGQLNGVPVNCLLVDNGSAANLIHKSMLFKLGKTDQAMILLSAGVTDFARGVGYHHS